VSGDDAESSDDKSGKSASSLKLASAASRSLRWVSESECDMDECCRDRAGT
jgi:hypothetical protein